ncbi:hypothetical protein L2E82_18570 [Cichorium intybus]|uniref:Uncharacterized protein n=1 Tax=Cichorium intybus TaxID=13427 RepID=A0ACB9FBI2_CICIN|nr:hypothetical protein L2E82_18570 [Cichorium intybus]
MVTIPTSHQDLNFVPSMPNLQLYPSHPQVKHLLHSHHFKLILSKLSSQFKGKTPNFVIEDTPNGILAAISNRKNRTF